MHQINFKHIFLAFLLSYLRNDINESFPSTFIDLNRENEIFGGPLSVYTQARFPHPDINIKNYDSMLLETTDLFSELNSLGRYSRHFPVSSNNIFAYLVEEGETQTAGITTEPLQTLPDPLTPPASDGIPASSSSESSEDDPQEDLEDLFLGEPAMLVAQELSEEELRLSESVWQQEYDNRLFKGIIAASDSWYSSDRDLFEESSKRSFHDENNNNVQLTEDSSDDEYLPSSSLSNSHSSERAGRGKSLDDSFESLIETQRDADEGESFQLALASNDSFDDSLGLSQLFYESTLHNLAASNITDLLNHDADLNLSLENLFEEKNAAESQSRFPNSTQYNTPESSPIRERTLFAEVKQEPLDWSENDDPTPASKVPSCKIKQEPFEDELSGSARDNEFDENILNILPFEVPEVSDFSLDYPEFLDPYKPSAPLLEFAEGFSDLNLDEPTQGAVGISRPHDSSAEAMDFVYFPNASVPYNPGHYPHEHYDAYHPEFDTVLNNTQQEYTTILPTEEPSSGWDTSVLNDSRNGSLEAASPISSDSAISSMGARSKSSPNNMVLSELSNAYGYRNSSYNFDVVVPKEEPLNSSDFSPSNMENFSASGYSDEYYAEYYSGQYVAPRMASIQHNHSYSHAMASSLDEDPYRASFKDKSKSKASKMQEVRNKDSKRLKELGIPITVDQVVNCTIEEFQMMLQTLNLNGEQDNLVKDIRRRGKNKVAAQNCRKRKLNQISDLGEDVSNLKKELAEEEQRRRMLDKEYQKSVAFYNSMKRYCLSHMGCLPPKFQEIAEMEPLCHTSAMSSGPSRTKRTRAERSK